MATLLEWVTGLGSLGSTAAGLAAIYASYRHTGRTLKQSVASTEAANQHALELNKRNNDLTLQLDERRARREALRWRIEQGVAALAKAHKLAQTASTVGSTADPEAAHIAVREMAYEIRPMLLLVFGNELAHPLVVAITDSARLNAAGEPRGPDVELPMLKSFLDMNRALEKMQAELEKGEALK